MPKSVCEQSTQCRLEQGGRTIIVYIPSHLAVRGKVLLIPEIHTMKNVDVNNDPIMRNRSRNFIEKTNKNAESEWIVMETGNTVYDDVLLPRELKYIPRLFVKEKESS